MKQFFIKKRITIPFFIIFSIIALNIVINFFIGGEKDFNFSSETTQYKIIAKDVQYLFPNRLTVKDITISSGVLSLKKISIANINANIDLVNFLIKQTIHLSEATFQKPTASGYSSIKQLKEEILDLKTISKNNTPKNITFKVIDGKILLPTETLSIQGEFKKQSNDLLLSGTLAKQNPKNTLNIQYDFSGTLNPYGLTIKNIEIKEDYFYVKLWGDYQDQVADLKGFAFKHFYQNSDEPVDYFTDINTRLSLSKQHLFIDRLSFNFNKTPINISGSISKAENIAFDLVFSSEDSYWQSLSSDKLKTANLRIKGDFKESLIDAEGEARFYLETKASHSNLIRYQFNQLKTNIHDLSQLKFIIPDSTIEWSREKNNMLMNINNFTVSLNTSSQNKELKFEANLHQGAFNGVVDLDKQTARIHLYDMNIRPFTSVFSMLPDITGILESQISINRLPLNNITGSLSLENGSIENIKFLNWFAKYFSLPSTKKLAFNTTSFNFSIDNKGTHLHNINLNSDDFYLSGLFNFDEDQFVSSKFSIFLSRTLMNDSYKLKLLLNRLKADIDPVQFDFRLSGRMDALNFQWLQTNTKERILENTPNFILRKIEHHVEDSIGDISVKSRR